MRSTSSRVSWIMLILLLTSCSRLADGFVFFSNLTPTSSSSQSDSKALLTVNPILSRSSLVMSSSSSASTSAVEEQVEAAVVSKQQKGRTSQLQQQGGKPWDIFGRDRRLIPRDDDCRDNMWLFEQPHHLGDLYLSMIRMTVYLLPNGEIVVYNPIAPADETVEKTLQIAGRVDHVIIPTNSYEHLVMVSGWVDRFPDATFWSLDGVETGARKQNILTDDVFPEEWGGELQFAHLYGNKVFQEGFLYHKTSKTVFAIDSFNKMTAENTKSWAARGALEALGTFDKASCSTKMLLWDQEGARRTLTKVFGWDFDTVYPTHGECPIKDGKEAMKQAFSFLFTEK